MGYLPLENMSATILFQLVSARLERRSIILTSNKSYGHWGSTLRSDYRNSHSGRLLHHSTTINYSRGELSAMTIVQTAISPGAISADEQNPSVVRRPGGAASALARSIGGSRRRVQILQDRPAQVSCNKDAVLAGEVTQEQQSCGQSAPLGSR